MSALPMVGDEVAGYRLRGVLGRGGMSVVYEAENPRLGSVVAVKVLAPELAGNDVFRARFLHESRIAASLNHPNVIPIYDVGPYETLLYIAMRYVAGADLRAVLNARDRISPNQALLLIGQAGRALDAAHRHDLVHRDVKPGNILVEHGSDEEPDHVYLADFGITKHATSRSGLTATGEFVGTIDYVAPEQIQGRPVDGRADIYSLGCVLYECLTGRVPFVKDLDAAVIWAHVEEPPTPPSAIRPELPRGIDDVIIRVLAKEPADRYSTCREFEAAARAAIGGVTGGPPTVLARRKDSSAVPRRQLDSSPPVSTDEPAADGGPPHDPPVPRRRAFGGPRRLAVLGALALIIAVAIGFWMVSRSSTPASSTASKSSSKSSSHTASALTANPLWQMFLAHTNEFTKGLLPPSSCHAQSSSAVTCSNPAPGVDTVNFRMFPSQKALYSAYVEKVRSFGNKRANSIRTNFGNCLAGQNNGEVSWNHNLRHPKTYSLPQTLSGRLSADQAAGRAFCTLVGSQYNLVWTQDAGHLLGMLSGFPHKDAWLWWRDVHHNIGAPHMQM